MSSRPLPISHGRKLEIRACGDGSSGELRLPREAVARERCSQPDERSPGSVAEPVGAGRPHVPGAMVVRQVREVAILLYCKLYVHVCANISSRPRAPCRWEKVKKKRVGNFTAKQSSFRAARADGRGKTPRPRARSLTGLPRSREWWFVGPIMVHHQSRFHGSAKA